MKKSIIVSIIITLITLVVALYFGFTLKGSVPIHFNMANDVTRYGSPMVLLVYPILNTLIILLLAFLPKIDPRGKNIKESGKYYYALFIMIPIFILGIQITSIFSMKGYNAISVINIFVGIFMIVIGMIMPHVKPNYSFGIRTPWTLHNETVWTKTHKECGKYFIVLGFIFMLCMFLIRPWDLIIPLICLGVLLVFVMIYSYMIYKKEVLNK